MPLQLDSLPELVKGLRHSCATRRLRAARDLRALGVPAEEALPALRRLLGDADPAVREAAVAAAGRMGPRALPLLTTALRHDDRHVRRQAVWALARLTPTAAAAAVLDLGQALADPDARTAAGAAQALAHLGRAAEPALPDLARALRGPTPVLCRLAAKALSSVGRAALPTLLDALAGEDDYVCREAALAVGWLGPRAADAVPALIALIQPPGDGAGQAPPRPAKPLSSKHRTLLAPEQPEDEPVLPRLCAIQALGRIGAAARPAIPLLLAALSDPMIDVRAAADEALALIRRAE